MHFIKQNLTYIYYKIYWFCIFFFKKRNYTRSPAKYTIGITTFRERYNILFKNLLARFIYLFPDTEIIIAVNGNYNERIQVKYLKEISKFCSNYPNVKLITHSQPKGLSLLWNQILQNATEDKIFIFNDDILFNSHFRENIYNCGILNENISLLNNSFSHFMVHKTIIEQVGCFDERFPEIGGEDDDFHVRLVIKGIELKRHQIKGLHNFKPKLKINSYGNKILNQINGYSNANTRFLYKKWEIRNEYFNDSIFINKSQGNYWKLKDGMETPNFFTYGNNK